MKLNLCATYWVLFLISIISSGLLFLIVASESQKSSHSGNSRSDSVVANSVVNGFGGDKNIEDIDLERDKNAPRRTEALPKEFASSLETVQDSDFVDSSVGSFGDSEIVSNVPKVEQNGGYDETAKMEDASTLNSRLPDIPTNPTVISLGDQSVELLPDPFEDNDIELLPPASEIIENETDLESLRELVDDHFTQNDFIVLPEINSVEELSSNEQSQKIDDSGGGGGDKPPDIAAVEVPESHEKKNATERVEEVPIPVFSEWAQKQMEEAEKKLEQEVVNSSSQRKNATTGTKPPLLKLRAKNYASPDCGAKIIASNAGAQNTGAVLTNSRDEYMLSPCTNRIWFVVELCEAIQAEKIDLANFELFSSSPKNFTVGVSNRFPTRDWSNVGRFIAEDQRNIQGFDLHPHLFGKFVRVDIHSHYNSEHFCPVSLFRVYGTSEFEAFETENRLGDDIDEYDDDFSVEPVAGNSKTNQENNNLFKSASDAVLSIVKKAAEVLVKTNTNKTESHVNVTTDDLRNCITPATGGNFTCDKCSSSLVANVNYLLSCRYYQLTSLLSVELLRSHLITSQVCAKRFNIATINLEKYLDCNVAYSTPLTSPLSEQHSYYLSALPTEYIASLCHLMAAPEVRTITTSRPNEADDSDAALNLTIDRKPADETFEAINNQRRTTGKLPNLQIQNEKVSNKHSMEDSPPVELTPPIVTHPPAAEVESTQDVNIFNIPEDATSDPPSVEQVLPPASQEALETPPTTDATEVPVITTSPPAAIAPGGSKIEDKDNQLRPKEAEIESSSWDSIDQLISEQGAGDSGNPNLNQYVQQKSSNGHHSESVFIRLSNRIKALERNMSLSGQYLEELSRRYKKQVEELQHSFAKTQQGIDDQNRRNSERERILIDENIRLRDDLEDLSLQLHAWIALLICVGAIVFLQIIISWFLIRSIKRTQQKLLQKIDDSPAGEKTSPGGSNKKLYRRKSIESVSSQRTPTTQKTRRPSEEAMRINGSYSDLLIMDENELAESRDQFVALAHNPKQRQRKISVCYSKDDNLPLRKRQNKNRFQRQESAPGDYSPREDQVNSQIEDLTFDDDEYENFIPGSDLAYNEFMPDGPSGVQLTVKDDQKILLKSVKSKKSNKLRRLSSPGFLKSPFGKSSGNGLGSSDKKSPIEPTSWEWYRSKKSDNKDPKNKTPSLSSHPTTTDSRSLSPPEAPIKINGHGNPNPSPNSSLSTNGGASSSENSLRMSEASANTNHSVLSNGNNYDNNSSGSSIGSRSKKSRSSLKKIFKKVF